MKRSLWTLAAVAVIVLLFRAFRSAPVLVEVATVERGTLVVSVKDDGRTRVRERYTISAPLQGRLLRTPLDPGDEVQAGVTVVSEFLPVSPGLLDARSRGEARARLLRATAALEEAEARRKQAIASHEYALESLQRIRGLVGEGIQTRDALDRAESTEEQAREGVRASEFAVQVARYEQDVARASLREALPEDVDPPPVGDVENPDIASFVGTGDPSGVLQLRSPIEGTVLRVFEESARALEAGTPILEIGNTELLEVVADFLSQDAVRVRPGMDVLVEGWGGKAETGEDQVLRGRVRQVEPGGFTKTSALGVEEQRVNILIDPMGDRDLWAVLGDGYRVEVQIVLWSDEDVLMVPAGALFRNGEEWAVFVVEDGRARLRAVRLGRRSQLDAQVLDGLSEGQEVVLYPSGLLEEGSRVESR